MKNLFIYITLILLTTSCTNMKKGERLEDFQNIEGMLYYQKPETGSTVYALFLPSKNSNTDKAFKITNYYENGIKFSTANGLIKDKLYSARYQKAILKGEIDRDVYLLTKVKIYFHINKPYYSEENVIDKDVKSDTLIYFNKKLVLKYRFSYLSIDSIKVR